MTRDEDGVPARNREPNPSPAAEMSSPGGEPLIGSQAKALIEAILADTDPGSGWAREALARLVQARPDDPVGVLLEHLQSVQEQTSPLPVIASTTDDADAVPVTAGDSVSVAVDPAVSSEIRSILEGKLLLTAFQPVHEVASEEIIGVEALSRFVSIDGAGADVWFREAAEAGLGPDLELAALQCALTAAARDVPRHLYVALNLTPEASRAPGVLQALASGALPPERIVIELNGTLDSTVNEPRDKRWNQMRALGLRVAVSAPGVAFLPMDELEKFRPEIIKLPRHLMENIDTNEGQRIRARAIIELAARIGATVIAEGIETTAEFTRVKALNITAAQGFLFGRPTVSPPEWSAWNVLIEEDAQTSG